MWSWKSESNWPMATPPLLRRVVLASVTPATKESEGRGVPPDLPDPLALQRRWSDSGTAPSCRRCPGQSDRRERRAWMEPQDLREPPESPWVQKIFVSSFAALVFQNKITPCLSFSDLGWSREGWEGGETPYLFKFPVNSSLKSNLTLSLSPGPPRAPRSPRKSRKCRSQRPKGCSHRESTHMWVLLCSLGFIKPDDVCDSRANEERANRGRGVHLVHRAPQDQEVVTARCFLASNTLTCQRLFFQHTLVLLFYVSSDVYRHGGFRIRWHGEIQGALITLWI